MQYDVVRVPQPHPVPTRPYTVHGDVFDESITEEPLPMGDVVPEDEPAPQPVVQCSQCLCTLYESEIQRHVC